MKLINDAEKDFFLAGIITNRKVHLVRSRRRSLGPRMFNLHRSQILGIERRAERDDRIRKRKTCNGSHGMSNLQANLLKRRGKEKENDQKQFRICEVPTRVGNDQYSTMKRRACMQKLVGKLGNAIR